MDKQDILIEIEYYIAKIKILLTKYREYNEQSDSKILSQNVIPGVIKTNEVCTSCEG